MNSATARIERRARALQLNTEGWEEQMASIGRHVAAG